MINNKKGQAGNLLIFTGKRLVSLGAGFFLAALAGIPLFLNTVKNIFAPPQQTSPPLWVIALVGVIIIMIFRRKR